MLYGMQSVIVGVEISWGLYDVFVDLLLICNVGLLVTDHSKGREYFQAGWFYCAWRIVDIVYVVLRSRAFCGEVMSSGGLAI